MNSDDGVLIQPILVILQNIEGPSLFGAQRPPILDIFTYWASLAQFFAWNIPFPSQGSGRLMRTNSISVNCRFAARRSHSLRKIGIGAVAGKEMPEYMFTILGDILETGKLT